MNRNSLNCRCSQFLNRWIAKLLAQLKRESKLPSSFLCFNKASAPNSEVLDFLPAEETMPNGKIASFDEKIPLSSSNQSRDTLYLRTHNFTVSVQTIMTRILVHMSKLGSKICKFIPYNRIISAERDREITQNSSKKHTFSSFFHYFFAHFFQFIGEKNSNRKKRGKNIPPKFGYAKIAAMVLCCGMLCSGCWNYQDLNEVTVVAGISVDEGQDHRYNLALEAIVMESASKDESVKSTLFEGEGDTVYEALDDIERKISGTLYYGNMQVLVISHQMAEDGMLYDVLEGFFRDPERRETVNVIVSEDESAKKLITPNPEKSEIASYEIQQNNNKNEKVTSQTFRTRTFEAYNELKRGTSDLSIPVYHIIEQGGSGDSSGESGDEKNGGKKDKDDEKNKETDKNSENKKENEDNKNEKSEENKKAEENGKDKKKSENKENEDESKNKSIESDGCALFRGCSMIESLGNHDMPPFLFGSGKIKGGGFSFKMEDSDREPISLFLRENKTKLDYDYSGGKLTIFVDIASKMDIYEMSKSLNVMDSDIVDQISNRAEQELNSRVSEIFKKTQEIGSEPFGVATKIYRSNSKLWDQIKSNFMDIYKNSDIIVKSKIRIINTGFIMKY
jgi:hypothetical protein